LSDVPFHLRANRLYANKDPAGAYWSPSAHMPLGAAHAGSLDTDLDQSPRPQLRGPDCRITRRRSEFQSIQPHCGFVSTRHVCAI